MQIDPKDLFKFELDEFQMEAFSHLDCGKSVVVCAPTGSGKTVVAEYAVELAIASGKRCYYTTPLKALSNQKLFDFRLKYGEEKVGLLTGDVSVNRDAPVVVMTTEVFRNMLYGTILGEVKENLRDVKYVILDECHYMNDAERGTVWEESIIYAPTDIQLVALSATIANAQELTTWIDQTHGPTALVKSDYRPVPLRFHYFADRRLHALLNQGQGLNKQLKSRFAGNKRNEKRRRYPPGKMGPHPADVLASLSGRDMLPAIYFLFSRRGCVESMKRSRGIPLLSAREEKQLKSIVAEYTRDNVNLVEHPFIDYLYQGIAVHHAGMLPSWKGLVEKLFQKGLLKVVFATETLAAGINMPARSTVISALSKRGDEGHRDLTASEFLQMSGRAGRRGMDELGHVVVLDHVFESVETAGKLAVAPADPLFSNFTPSYGMVLNLLERHTIDEARDLIERSFGQFLVGLEMEPLELKKIAWEGELDGLSSPLCPDEIGDLGQYQKYLDAVHVIKKQLKAIDRGMKQASPAGGDATGRMEAIGALKLQMKETLEKAHAMPCHGCPVQKPCSNKDDRVRHLQLKVKGAKKRIARETDKYWRTFEALSNILRLKGYLMGDNPTRLGRAAAAIRGTNELFLAETAMDGCLAELMPSELAAVLTALVSEESRVQDAYRIPVSPGVDLALTRIRKIGRDVYRTQRDFEVDIPVDFSAHLSGMTEMWAQGACWEAIRNATPFDEGDVVRSLRRTLDLCRQFMRAPEISERLADLCRQAEALIARDEIKEEF